MYKMNDIFIIKWGVGPGPRRHCFPAGQSAMVASVRCRGRDPGSLGVCGPIPRCRSYCRLGCPETCAGEATRRLIGASLHCVKMSGSPGCSTSRTCKGLPECSGKLNNVCSLAVFALKEFALATVDEDLWEAVGFAVHCRGSVVVDVKNSICLQTMQVGAG